MSNDIAISIRDLSKAYLIAHGALKRPTFRDVVMDRVRHPFRRPQRETFWALKDVSFDVKKGEVVGIIGRNGAGKSTLLKILSRITEPTSGCVELYGRVGSLLEVGTGFHPELTGRENIFLNGAILGMSRPEIRKQFDAIVDFAEVEKFLDTPVKRYSSGMYVRLAFAVAAHLNPEILIVDEVLSVGDAEFQKKCLGKMQDVATGGRTVLFVSHNMTAVGSLCSRVMLLDGGNCRNSGPSSEVIREYHRQFVVSNAVPLSDRTDRRGDGSSRIVSVSVENTRRDEAVCTDCRLRVTIGYAGDTPLRQARFLVGVYDLNNVGVFLLDSDAAGGLPAVLPPRGEVVCVTHPINITAGMCCINVALMKGGSMADYIQNALTFDICPTDVYGTGKVPGRDWVLCVVKHDWTQG